MTDNALVKIIKLLSCAAVCVPLVFSVYFYPSHVAPQTFLFRLIVEAMLFVYLLLVLRNSAFVPKLSPMLWATGAFFAVQALSGALGVDSFASFFSDFERHWGFITIIHFFIFFIVVSSVLHEKSSWRWIFMVSVMVSAISAVYGAYQFLFDDIGRIYSTIGNAGFFATYLLLNVVFALWLALGVFFTRPWRFVLGGVAVLNAVVAVLTSTRADMLALVAGVFVMGCGYLFWYEYKTKRIKTLLITSLIIFVIGCSAILALAHTDFGKRAGLSRLAIFSSTDVTTRTRLFAWSAGWYGFLEKPILGVGPENFKIVFNKYFDADYYTYETGETEFDRAHNIFIEQLATTGVIGFISYIGMFVVFLFLLWRGKRLGAFGSHTVIMMISFVVIYAVQGFFNMDTLTSFLPLFLAFGYVASRTEHMKDANPHVSREIQKPLTASFAFTAFVLLCAFAYVGWVINVNPARANRALSDADDVLQHVKEIEPNEAIDKANEKYTHALDFSTYGKGTAQKSLARYALNYYQTFGKQAPQEFADTLFPRAITEINAYLLNHPKDYLVYSTLGKLANIQLLFMQKGDEKIDQILASAQTLAPNRLEILFVRAQRALIEGDYSTAITLSEEGIAKNKKFFDFYHIAFLAYNLTDKEDEAFRVMDNGVRLNMPISNEKEIGWLAEQYEKRGMMQNAQELRIRNQESGIMNRE